MLTGVETVLADMKVDTVMEDVEVDEAIIESVGSWEFFCTLHDFLHTADHHHVRTCGHLLASYPDTE